MFENATPTFVTAFFAGLLSFVSPCVLPLIPGYLSYISGVTLDDMQGTGRRRRGGGGKSRRRVRHRVALLRPRLLFRVRLARRRARARSASSCRTASRLRLLGKIAGVVVFIFGLHTMGASANRPAV